MGVNTIHISRKDITCVAFEPDSPHIVGADGLGAIRQWSIEGGVGVDVSLSAMRMSKAVHAVVVSADGRWIVCGGAGHKVVVWSSASHQKAIEVTEHTSHVYAIDVSSDSQRFASGSHDLTAQIFDITTGVRLIPPLQHVAQVIGVKFSPNGNRIATATLPRSSLGVYDARSGDKLFEIPVSTATWTFTTPLAWSSDSRQLFVASLGKITCLDTYTRSHSEWAIHDIKSPKASIVTSGKFIACSAGSSVSLWDSISHKLIACVDNQNPVTSLAISYDRKFLACGHTNGITLHSLEEYLPEHYLKSPNVSQLPLMQIGDSVLNLWVQGNLTEAEATLSDEIEQCSDPIHYAYAVRALIRAHLGQSKLAMEDAEMSLHIIRSPIGQLAKSVVYIGLGELEIILDDIDFVFRECDLYDTTLLLVINSILMFVCNKRNQGISRLRRLISTADEKMKDYYLQVLGNMYLQQGDYQDAMETLGQVKNLFTPEDRSLLMTISIIFNWNFDNLRFISWRSRCEALYTSGSLKELGDVLQKILDTSPEDEGQLGHSQILEEIINRSGEVKLLEWTGKSSCYNSCLSGSLAVYGRTTPVLPCHKLEGEELNKRISELREIFPLADALMAYGWITRSQLVRFAHFRLHLPCIVFHVKGLEKQEGNVYHAETVGLGNVEFTTADVLPLENPRSLVFVNPRIDRLREAPNQVTISTDTVVPDVKSSSKAGSSHSSETDADLVHTSVIEEVPPAPPSSDPNTDAYSRALALIAHLGQPFTALLLLRRSDGAYTRVAADREIAVCGMRNNVPKDLRVEVLEVL